MTKDEMSWRESTPCWANPTPLSDATGERRSIRVLAAEPGAVNQLVLKTLLHQVGIDGVMVDNGSTVVEAWGQEHWLLILIDVDAGDGLDAVRTIRARERELRRPRTPIIALTTERSSSDCLSAGCDARVAKPIIAANLYQAVASALSQERASSGLLSVAG